MSTHDPLAAEAIKKLYDWATITRDTARRIGMSAEPSLQFGETILALIEENKQLRAAVRRSPNTIVEGIALKDRGKE